MQTGSFNILHFDLSLYDIVVLNVYQLFAYGQCGLMHA
jgi:hypothetical protein